MSAWVESAADALVRQCIDGHRSFAMIAGAGSGKTSSLVDALGRVRDREGRILRRQGQRVACITFTKRAVEVIKSRLGFDDLYLISTLHSFLWGQISHFHDDIREALAKRRIPALIDKAKEDDNGGQSKKAQRARAKIERLAADHAALGSVKFFEYADTNFSDYSRGQIGHDDVIEIATYLFSNNATFRRITGLRFPYIFVDEAQDTFEGIVVGLNLVCAEHGLPMIGYFGDPWQQIYDRSAGAFAPPDGGEIITKTENFRCSKSVIRLLNAYRGDVEQYAAGDNKHSEGSVEFLLVKAEEPTEPRKRYAEDQIERALAHMDTAAASWGWAERDDVVKLFLARQMIARRLGFADLNRLFTGEFASSRAQDAFEVGEHFLLKPFLSTICPLINALVREDERQIIDLLRRDSPAFAVDGLNAEKSLKMMIETSQALVGQLQAKWNTDTIGGILRFCVDKQIIQSSERLNEHLERAPRSEAFDEDIHALDKGDWLVDVLFQMLPEQVANYADYIANNTAYSTQHGVKGEEYKKVMVVYDDVEAAWNQYSFSKVLTPLTAGEPTERQRSLTQKLAYVSFSRAMEDLRVLMFTSDPDSARTELINSKLLKPDQIRVM
ncbi:UvrD-helicase domain-containing protein [Burkholderia stabilis]|uniref:UvrD-helicase domain-containing protein n=1 Tax=Burkholderia stabilis TaxID=95485 RepID=UPI00158A489F|nr:UvrD-helicase domain-containing protein [Burkholderia stabilis]HDR9488666.1 ATP-dependent helicase [Burkholderia stabilis]HDR9523677.1 ATP-dependent helicase [Burkholderia stabilis]HDR9531413.1 ATP-dependent helicase [Burkholderia stabilis]HDR9541031.1 ATP-dependent helicase [Burkholderia stabilis]HDR9544025.1 ATP-dependent helicase [Burkholderia stabilis]